MINRFARGFRAPFSGFKLLISDAGFWRLATIPFIISIILFGLGLFLGWTTIPPMLTALVAGLVPTATFWGAILYYPILILTMLSFAVLLFACVFLVTNLIATPFNALLAEKTLVHLGRIKPQSFKLGSWIKMSSRMLVISMVRAFFFIILGIGFFFLGLIPGLQVPAAFGGLLLISFDCSDYAFEALQNSLFQRFRKYRRYFIEFCGFSCALGLTFMIPGLNLLLYPATVVGASLLVASFEENQ
jgi:CysZ protein